VQSRRKKERKTHIPLANPADPARRVKVPYAEYPAPMVFYKMGRAGLLEGLRTQWMYRPRGKWWR
jgi:hypothetical protein